MATTRYDVSPSQGWVEVNSGTDFIMTVEGNGEVFVVFEATAPVDPQAPGHRVTGGGLIVLERPSGQTNPCFVRSDYEGTAVIVSVQ